MDVIDMLIAQRSVAGEVQTRLDAIASVSAHGDHQALTEFACDRSNLPWVIFRAAHRASHIVELPARARCVLAALARTVDANRPYAAIFARRELLTGRAMQSMRTFYRSLDDLEVAGLIARSPQTRYGSAGLFGRAYLYLTPKAATLLGLVEHVPASSAPSNPDVSETSARNSLSLAQPCVTLADGAIYKDLNPTKQKRQPARLPADLIRLRGLGFRDFLIFKLMREAGQNAKRLSDVVEATWEHLRRARFPISYLRSLLRAPVDFAFRVRTKLLENATAIEVLAQETDAEKTCGTLNGNRFVSEDGLRTFEVADDGASVVVRYRSETASRIHRGDWRRSFVDALTRGHILAVDEAGAARAPLPRDVDDRFCHTSADAMTALSTSRSAIALHELKQFLRKRRGGGVALPSSQEGSDSHSASGIIRKLC
jgi:hypothetical protein